MCAMFHETRFKKAAKSLQLRRDLHTDMKVPGKKKRVTSVMIFIDTVSVFVLRAISFISPLMLSMFFVEDRDSLARSLLLCVL